MGCALIYIAVFCSFVCLQGFAYGEETVSRDMTMRTQLFADVFLLKEGVDRLQVSMEDIRKKYSSQSELMNEMHTQLLTHDAGYNSCGKISNILNETLSNNYMFEDRMITKLEEIQQEQELSYNKMQLKLDKLTNQMHRFNILEEHLVQQQTQMENFMDNQKKMLQDFMEVILKTQAKLNSVDDTTLTQFNEWYQHFRKFGLTKQSKVPIGPILG